MADLFDFKTTNNKGFRYIFIITDNFSKVLWAIPLKNKNSQTITQNLSKSLNKSKGSQLKIEKEFYNSVFQN